MNDIKDDEAQTINVEENPKESTEGTSEAAASQPAPQLPTPLVADPIAEKGSEAKEKVREQNGGKEDEDLGPNDGAVPEVAAEPIEESENNLPDPAPVLRRSSRA
ncbi:unnamed protein product [Caenorhabditis brenneri]